MFSQLLELCEQRRQLDVTVSRRVGTEATNRLLELSLRPDPASPRCLVPRDRDVDEPLQEVALLGRRSTPRVLELLVRREVLARADQLEPARECRGVVRLRP
ncbi:MAG TPA: hypothetical protein VEH52_07565 [Gaiellaceae bacterium]|nr:hypothetical protein [Gaiellaceae bacterium]